MGVPAACYTPPVRRWSRRPSALTLLVGAALVLLPILAFLQYRWIGQVSDAERERRERSLRHATRNLAQDLDVELVRAFVGLQVDGETLLDEDWNGYANRVAAWRAAAVAPAAVRDVLLVDGHDGRLRLRQWDPAVQQFVPAEWPADVAALRPKFQRELDERRDDREDGPPRVGDLLNESGDAIVAPVAPLFLGNRDGHPSFRSVFGYTIIQLDTTFIREEFLPALVDRHLRQGPEDEYRVAVVDRRDPTKALYQLNVENLSDLVARPDAAADLYGLRPDQFAVIRAAAGSLRGPGASTRERRRSLFFSLRRPTPEGRDEDAFDDLMRWRLVARHRAGSLEAAVGVARTRNLLMSFGILLLMAGSVAVLAATARRAQRLARQQIEFVAAVSHELRTPVSVISSAADNLATGFVTDPARVRQYGARIQAESRRLGDTVERVLLYAGIEAGRGVGHRVPVSVARLVDDGLAAVASEIAGSGATVETDVAADLPPLIADAAALRACLQNLIANALKYGGSRPWVKVSASAASGRKGREVRIAVADRGIGIEPGDLPHIFEPFYRGREALAQQITGNGLGLSIVKGIVESHGGYVTVQSRPGEGSTFVLHFPAAEGDTAAVGDSLAAARAAAGGR